MTSVYDLPDWAALIAAVKANPDDDLPRLVAADWLQEHGEDERAEFIRRQCCNDVVLPRLTMLTAFESVLNAQPHQCVRGAEAWTATVSSVAWGGLLLLTFRRGFVSRVSGPLAALVGERCVRCGGEGKFRSGEWLTYWEDCPDCHGTGRTEGVLRRLVRREPVAEVVVSDREPWQVAGGVGRWGWSKHHDDMMFPGNRSVIPAEILDLIPEADDSPIRGFRHRRWFRTADAARSALSSALLLWAAQPEEVPA